MREKGRCKYYNEERPHVAIGQMPPMMLLNHDAQPARHGEQGRENFPAVQRSTSLQNLADAREKMEDWRKYYNEERPHGAIGQMPPIMLLNHDGAASPPW